MSIIMGIVKVYPALNCYSKNQNLSEDGYVMEIYDMPSRKIVY
jgi:hypothetical protein